MDFFPDDDEAAAVAVGERLEEDAVDDEKSAVVAPMPRREGEDGGDGEAGGLVELAEAVAHRAGVMECIGYLAFQQAARLRYGRASIAASEAGRGAAASIADGGMYGSRGKVPRDFDLAGGDG